ncbi:Clavaminate synthase-like protein [Mycena floridula]|nr:Clavaminate synthase-like protein [Mycena floridula]
MSSSQLEADSLPQLGSFDYVLQTKEKLDWADLVSLDLAQYSTVEGKKELADTLIEAVREKGFFYVKNFNISPDRVNRQFALGKKFYDLPLSEKVKYIPEGLAHGAFNGYIPAGRLVIDPTHQIRDKAELYNIPKFNGDFTHDHPAVIMEQLKEIEDFVRDVHSQILDPLFVLLAIALELPEDYFTKIHQYQLKSEDHLRQPIAGLQIRHPMTNEWRWVKPQDGALTVNACDALQFLTGGYVKSTIHRVGVPPKDQQHVDRLGLIYFSRPQNDLHLSTIQESPSGNPVPTMEEWTFAKQKWQRTFKVDFAPGSETAKVIPGFEDKVYA